MSTTPEPTPSGAVRVERDGAVVRIHLDRPPHNILSRGLNRALAAAVAEHAPDPSVAALVLDGGAARGFSAGVEVAEHTPETVEGMLADFHAVVRALWAAPCLTLAAVHGFAMGGGLELALACDLVVAEENARLGLPEVALGAYPPVAAALLPGRIGWARACELVLGGDPITVERALALGIVNRSCAAGALQGEVARFLGPFLNKSPAVLRAAKHALREGAGGGPADALARIERLYLDELMKLEDAREGVRAFVDKRAPRFRNG